MRNSVSSQTGSVEDCPSSLLFRWGSEVSQKVGLCYPSKMGVFGQLGYASPCEWGPGVEPRQGRGHRARVLPPAAVGPPLHRRTHMKAVLPLLFLLLLLPVLQPVDLHGLGGLGLPSTSRTVRQSHGCKHNNLLKPRYIWSVILPSIHSPFLLGVCRSGFFSLEQWFQPS